MILILLREVRYLLLIEWIRRKVANDNYAWQICKQALNKLLLAHNFLKMFFTGQNLDHVLVTYFFVELLIPFWITVVDIFCLKFDFPLHT